MPFCLRAHGLRFGSDELRRMERRRSIVDHPFGNLKQWLFGNGRFLLRELEGTRAEIALAVTAYNLKRAISVLGTKKMMQLMG
ncbi:DDE family transposase [Pseudomonas fluorescens]|nr:DDE family transposase [Pseudomonas fluorescens]